MRARRDVVARFLGRWRIVNADDEFRALDVHGVVIEFSRGDVGELWTAAYLRDPFGGESHLRISLKRSTIEGNTLITHISDRTRIRGRFWFDGDDALIVQSDVDRAFVRYRRMTPETDAVADGA